MTTQPISPGAPRPRASIWRQPVVTSLNLLIFLACLAIIGGIWLTTLQRIASEREQAIAASMKANSNLAIAFEQQVFRTLKSAEQIAVFVRDQYLRQGSALDLRNWVKRHVIREPMFSVISIVDEQGEIVSSSLTPDSQVNYRDREFFIAQRDAPQDSLFISHPVLGRITQRWQIPMSLRISHPDGRFAGVVVLAVDPVHFTDFYRQADLGSQGMLELTGFDGIVRGRKIGNQTGFDLDAHNYAWFQRRQHTAQDEFIDEQGSADAIARIISYRTMQDYPLMVTVGTEYADELAPVLQRSTSYRILAGIATVALLVFASLLIITLSRQRRVAVALQASEALFRATFHQAAMGITHITPEGRILRCNEKFCRMLGYSSDELHDRSVFELGDSDDQGQVRQFLANRLSTEAPGFSPEIEKAYRRKDGTLLWVCEALAVVKDLRERPDFLVVVTQDITARKALEARLAHDALHDVLTGLPNRLMFHDRLSRALVSARRYRRSCAILYIDLDGFKTINDHHGHGLGDLLLQHTALRLQACVRSEDTVSRLGGDEFGIVLTSLAKGQDCPLIARKIIEALSKPFDLEGHSLLISASIGAAVFPSHGDDTATLLAQADSAMYAAKRAGKNRFSWPPAQHFS